MNLDPNRKFVLRLVALLSLIFLRIGVSAQDKENFADRKALIVSNCPLVELRYFNFKNQNVYGQGAVFELSVGWKNISEQPLVAFEICILEFDPFNRRLRETRWLVAGKDSSDWTPLEPGASGGDGLTSRGDETVFTGIAYVVAARLKDGTIWMAEEKKVEEQIRKIAPSIQDLSGLKSESKPKAISGAGR